MTTNTDAAPSLPDDLNPEVVKATAQFIGKITGLVPPPHNAFPPEWHGYLRTFTKCLYEIAGVNAGPVARVAATAPLTDDDAHNLVTLDRRDLWDQVRGAIHAALNDKIPKDCVVSWAWEEATNRTMDIFQKIVDTAPASPAAASQDERAAFEWPTLPALPPAMWTCGIRGGLFTEHQMQGYANAYGKAVRAALQSTGEAAS